MNRPGRIQGVACLLILAAFGVYLAALTQRSLWLDEGISLVRVNSPWPQLLQNQFVVQGVVVLDEHPPLFYACLKIWQVFAGSSEFALKLLPALATLLCVPLGFCIGKRAFNAFFGVALAAFAAASAGLLWYSSELRVYAFVAALAYALLYAMLRALTQPSKKAFALVLLVLLMGLGTNYFFVPLAGGVGVVFALLLAQHDLSQKPPRFARMAVILLAGAGAYLYFGRASSLGVVGQGITQLLALQFSGSVSPIQQLSSGNLFGINAADFTGDKITWVAAGLAVLGFFLPAGKISRRAAFFAVLPYLSALLVLMLLTKDATTFRYVIFATPAFFFLLARALFALGAGALWRKVMAFGLGAVLLAVQMFGVVSTLTPSPTWQDDWRSLSRYIHAGWQEGDAIVIRDIYTPDTIMRRYLGGLAAPLTPLSQMPEAPPYARRIWLVNTGGEDPAAAKNGLFARWWQTEKVSFGGHTNTLEVRLYETESPLTAQIPSTATPAPLPAGGAGGGQPLVIATETHTGSPLALRPDVWLTVYWQRNGANDLGQYGLAVRLVSGGQVWNTAQLPARLDTLPGWGDQFARVAYRILTPVGLPQLPYELQVTLQRGEKNEPAATYIFPADTNTWRIPSHAGALPDQPVWRGPSATLLAAEFEREFHPGDAVPLALTWRKDSPQPDRWDTEMWIKPLLGGAAINQSEKKNGDALAGSPVRAMLSAKIPETAAAGWYRLGMDRITSEGRDSIALGFIRVSDFPIARLPDAPTRPVTARVGEFDLLGYRLDQPFERRATLSFFTYWKASAQPRRDGVLFLFVLGPDGKLVAQDDNPPEGRSTLTFRAGEQIKQLHRVVLPGEAAPGAYHLYAGIYNRSDIARWEAAQNGAPAKDNLVDLGTIELK